MQRVIRTNCGCKVVCECPDTVEWGGWCDPDAVAFYCDLVAYRDRSGRWLDAENRIIDGRQFESVPSAGMTLFSCVRLAPRTPAPT